MNMQVFNFPSEKVKELMAKAVDEQEVMKFLQLCSIHTKAII